MTRYRYPPGCHYRRCSKRMLMQSNPVPNAIPPTIAPITSSRMSREVPRGRPPPYAELFASDDPPTNSEFKTADHNSLPESVRRICQSNVDKPVSFESFVRNSGDTIVPSAPQLNN